MPRYPFSPEILDALPEELAELFRGLELKLLEEICSRLRLAGELNEVTVQDVRALRSHGVDLEDIKRAISKTTGVGMDKLEALLDDVVARNQRYYTSMIDIAQVTFPQRLVDERDIDAIRRQTVDGFTNLTRSMGFLVQQGSGKVVLPPAKAYQWALDSAELQTMSGAISYDQAIGEAVRQLAKSGLCVAFDKNGAPVRNAVKYERGGIQQLDVCIRRAVMTGVNQLNQKYREQSMDYLETDLLEVTAHLGARNIDGPNGWENHAKWQGKVYRWAEKPKASNGDYPDFEDTCGYGSVTGIGGANCRHSYWPYIEGVSERTYTDAELEAMKPENRPKTVFEGREYNDYQAAQMQRRVEREIRKQKRFKTAFEAAGLSDAAAAAGSKLRALNEKYRAFSKAAGLPEQRERMRAQYVDDASYAKAEKLLEKSSRSGILKDTGYQGVPITEEAIQRVPLVQPEGWSIEQAERLQAAHRDLLRAVKEKPVGTEAGAVYTPDMRLIERRIGADSEQTISLPRYASPHILIHNHPSGELFSHTDIAPFVMNENMQAITAVGNSGNVYMLIKTDDYDGFRFLQAYNAVLGRLQGAVRSSDVRKYIAIMEKFLEEVGEYGANFIKRG